MIDTEAPVSHITGKCSNLPTLVAFGLIEFCLDIVSDFSCDKFGTCLDTSPQKFNRFTVSWCMHDKMCTILVIFGTGCKKICGSIILMLSSCRYIKRILLIANLWQYLIEGLLFRVRTYK